MFSIFLYTVNVELNCLPHGMLNLFTRFACCYTPRKIRGVGAIPGLCLFNNDEISIHFNPDCFRILFKVPRASSSLGLPAIVTRPFLNGCLYCLWLPRVATKYHPSASIILIAFRNFVHLFLSISFYLSIVHNN